MNKGLELAVPPPDLLGGERAWRLYQSPMANDLIIYAYIIKPWL